MDKALFLTMFPLLLEGLKYTFFVAITGIVIGTVIGCLAGYALQCNYSFFRMISYFYIWIVRGTPLLVQALYVYFVLPQLFGISLNITYANETLVSESVTAGIIAIAVNSGAFIAEIVRGAIESVDKGIQEAGLALGLSHWQVLCHITFPIGFKHFLPALFNQFIISTKDTSVLTIIVVPEITHQIQNYAITTYKTIPAYTFGASFYLLIISLLMIIQKVFEKKYLKAG